MEGNPVTSQATQQSPQAPAQASEASSAAEKVLFGGQEMDVESFLKSRKHKLKVDGKDTEVDYDELVKGYSHGSAANARMREAAEARKKAEAAEKRERELMDSIYAWKSDPSKAFAAMEKLGIDIDSVATDRVLNKMRLEMMSPEERKAYDMEQELNRYKSKEAQEAESKRKAEMEQMRQQAVTELEDSIVKHLEKNPNLSPALVGRAVDAMIAAIEEGRDLPIEEAFKHASGWYEKERKSIFDLELKALLSQGQLPKELAEAVRKADMAALRKEPPKRDKAPEERSKSKSSAANMDDFFSDLDRRFKK